MTELFSPIGAPAAFDIRSMWITGVWSGAVRLPSIARMIASAEKDKKWVDGLYKLYVPLSLPTFLNTLLSTSIG